MTRQNLRGRLELTWMGKDLALIPTETDKYGYTWVDKSDPRACQTHYLIDDGHVGDTADGGIHDNLLVTGESGDILEALTRVPELAMKYVGRVKCVYIDPPFNTKKTFTNYEDNLEHSVWLTMMRDRLELLKKLLADDGSIWVHLDQSENHRMRVLMDEVFGSRNFLAEIAWQKADSSRNDSPEPSADHDVIIAYRRSPSWVMNRLARTAASNARFRSPDGDPMPWWDDNPTAPSGERNQLWIYAIQQPITGKLLYPARGRCWFAEPNTILRAMSEYAEYEFRDIGDDEKRADIADVPLSEIRAGVKALMLTRPLPESAASARTRISAGVWPEIVLRTNGEGGLGRKAYPSEKGLVPSSWWDNEGVGHNRRAKAEIKALFPTRKPFATPKPEALLERILTIASKPGDLVLDCFAGSGTTAAVAHKMGRRWVACELLPETVAAFTRPRLEKVVAGTDSGGVTSWTDYEAAVPLPGITTVDEARLFNTVLSRAIKTLVPEADEGIDESAEKESEEPLHRDSAEDGSAPELDEETIAALRTATKLLKAATRTTKITTKQWHGGGGFDVARLSPVWVGVDTDDTTGVSTSYITPEATGEILARSIAAHLGYTFSSGQPRFVGMKGRQRLAVVEGMLTEPKVAELAGSLAAGESVTIVCDGAPEGLSAKLGQLVKGSRLLVMPDDLFTFRSARRL